MVLDIPPARAIARYTFAARENFPCRIPTKKEKIGEWKENFALPHDKIGQSARYIANALRMIYYGCVLLSLPECDIEDE